MHGHTEAGVFCQEFAHYIPMGPEEKLLKESQAIEVALQNLIPGFITSTEQ